MMNKMDRRDRLLALLAGAGSILDLSGQSFSKTRTFRCRMSSEDALALMRDGRLVTGDIYSAYRQTCLLHNLPPKLEHVVLFPRPEAAALPSSDEVSEQPNLSLRASALPAERDQVNLKTELQHRLRLP